MNRLFCFGLGFSGKALAQTLLAAGWQVAGTTRSPEKSAALEALGLQVHLFPGEDCVIDEPLSEATHLLITIPPQERGDVVYPRYRDVIARNRNLRWVGYLSSTGVYGNRDGGWVDESSPTDPRDERNRLRLEAERNWLDLGVSSAKPVHIFRSAGIYGPGRNMLETVKAGKARRIEKEGHLNHRIHVEDLSAVFIASMARPDPGAIYNVCDDTPAPSKEVVEYACQLLGMDPPPVVPFAQAELSDMARTFYLNDKRIRNDKMKNELKLNLRYPGYRDGLMAIMDSAGHRG